MLRGNSLAKVDEKGRLKVPAAFRAAFEPNYGNEFFVTSLRGESVRLYPMEIWLRIEERLSPSMMDNPTEKFHAIRKIPQIVCTNLGIPLVGARLAAPRHRGVRLQGRSKRLRQNPPTASEIISTGG